MTFNDENDDEDGGFIMRRAPGRGPVEMEGAEPVNDCLLHYTFPVV